jgi:hypothetical protein
MITKLSEKITIELRAGLVGWSVDLYEWHYGGYRSTTQIFFSEEEQMARGFYMGYVVGFGRAKEGV